ncbi:MAG TPA: hypothetical protein VEN81_14600, partial [Planctomycetota bacterium]|nr:hypothetical protein [Planctomycetota bacterium]
CPFCGKRFNVSGIAAGSRLRCAGCTAVLTVPASDARPPAFKFTRSLLLQITGGVAAGLLAAVAIYLVLRPSTGRAGASADLAVLRGPGPDHVEPVADPPPFVDDPYSRARDAIEKEFGFRFLYRRESGPYLIALEPSERFHAPSLMEEYSQRLQAVLLAFRREFGEPLGLPEVQPALPVIVFNGRESFDSYFMMSDKRRMAESIKGIYEYDRRRIVVYHDPNVPIEVLLHEGAHQLVDYYKRMREVLAKRPSCYWFQEGVGTYFEGFRRIGGEIQFDPALSHGRLPTLKQALVQPGRKDFIPLNVLVGMTVDEFWAWFQRGQLTEPEDTTRKAQVYYAESWAFIHFLRQSGGNARKVLDSYFALEASGQGGKSAFEDLVREHLQLELAQLEDKFIAYIQGLR